MSIEEHTLGKTCRTNECVSICSILSKYGKPVSIKEIGCKLKKILQCIHNFCNNVCYLYIPFQHIILDNFTKQQLYKILNSNIVFYNQHLANDLKNTLLNYLNMYIANVATPMLIQVEFKSHSNRYRYFIAYRGVDKTFSILTCEGLIQGMKNVYEVAATITNDLYKSVHPKDIVYVRSLIDINEDKVFLKYFCQFNDIAIELTILNTILLSVLIKLRSY